jgi:CobQ-like glutamine amidotransferase family enzyme
VTSTQLSELRLISLFPSLLGTYGDHGNALILCQRARWRGIACTIITIDPQDRVPATGDLYVIGGGEDSAQFAAMAALGGGGRAPSPLARAVEAGAQVLAVCAGLQLLGRSFLDAAGTETAGLDLLDVHTTRLPRRAVGEFRGEATAGLDLPLLSGFENHGGHTILGPGVRPLATAQVGVGNGPDPHGRPPGEGAITDRIIATYLHGPVLARNPDLADLLLARALGVKVADLAPLDVPEHAALRAALGDTPGRGSRDEH